MRWDHERRPDRRPPRRRHPWVSAAGLAGAGACCRWFSATSPCSGSRVPQTLPARETLAMISGGLLVLGAVLTPMRAARAWGAALIAVFIGVWVVGLHLPKALASPSDLPNWLALARDPGHRHRRLPAVRGDAHAVAQRLCQCRHPPVRRDLCWCSAPRTSSSPRSPAAMIPKWLPMPLALAYLTSAIHTLTGLALLIRRWVRHGGDDRGGDDDLLRTSGAYPPCRRRSPSKQTRTDAAVRRPDAFLTALDRPGEHRRAQGAG